VELYFETLQGWIISKDFFKFLGDSHDSSAGLPDFSLCSMPKWEKYTK
jgi:hypothetical protein